MLSGCGLGKSAAERINAAFPVGPNIIAGKAGLNALAKDRPLDAKAVDDDFAVRLNARALDCGHRYQPSIFEGETKIHETLIGAKDCFTKADQKLEEWIVRRRIGLVLSAPPLRPLPIVAPNFILAGGNIAQA
ncbi:MAG TPA: hypothetical protein VK660_00090, partial [Xanthomonadaceae bacterium]|nr:hypothetical protein [Xanthomonadaceae bacterium]